MSENKFTEILSSPPLDEATRDKGIILFHSYKKAGTIEAEYDNKTWKITNEVIVTKVYFDIENYKNDLPLSKEEFIDCLKTYFLFNLGKLQLTTLISAINIFKEIVSVDNIVDVISEIKLGYRILDFFNMLPVEMPFIDELEEYLSILRSSKDGQRQLCSIQTYFKFDEILTRFYSEETDRLKKLFYFPLWFWWNFTAIIPTRPTEFTLTPRDCLKKN